MISYVSSAAYVYVPEICQWVREGALGKWEYEEEEQ